MKYKALPLLPLAAALAACAGGVAEPHVPVSIPTATPLPAGEVTLSSDNGNIENINTAGAGSASDAPSRSRRSLDAAPQNTSGISIRQREVEKDYFGYKSKETSFIFKTPGGAQYALSSYADPITVSYSSPDFKIPDRHAG
ncbi:TPA: hemoglobin-haptoglobin-utilization protein HupA, partial [Neisseria gonorrhoeae]